MNILGIETKKEKNKKLADEIKNKLTGFIDIMKNKNIANITLSIYKSEPQEFRSGWKDMSKEIYFPFETLEAEEQQLIREEKHYTRISLVQGEIPNIISYKNPALEETQRRKVHPLLPKLKIGSPLEYQTDMKYTSLEDAAKQWSEAGFTPAVIQSAFEEGMSNYRKITESLYEQAGVYDSLKSLENKKHPLDEIIHK